MTIKKIDFYYFFLSTDSHKNIFTMMLRNIILPFRNITSHTITNVHFKKLSPILRSPSIKVVGSFLLLDSAFFVYQTAPILHRSSGYGRNQSYQSNEYSQLMKSVRKIKDYFWIDYLHKYSLDYRPDSEARYEDFLKDFPYSEKRWREGFTNKPKINRWSYEDSDWAYYQFTSIDDQEEEKNNMISRTTEKQIKILEIVKKLPYYGRFCQRLINHETQRNYPRGELLMELLYINMIENNDFSYLSNSNIKAILTLWKLDNLMDRCWYDYKNAREEEKDKYIRTTLKLYQYNPEVFDLMLGNHKKLLIAEADSNLLEKIIKDNKSYIISNSSDMLDELIKTPEGRKILRMNFDEKSSSQQHNIIEKFIITGFLDKESMAYFNRYIDTSTIKEILDKNLSKVSWDYLETNFSDFNLDEYIINGKYQFKIDEVIPEKYQKKYPKELLKTQKMLKNGAIINLAIEFEKQNPSITLTEREIFLKTNQPKLWEYLRSQENEFDENKDYNVEM